jgi:hypothetical protein
VLIAFRIAPDPFPGHFSEVGLLLPYVLYTNIILLGSHKGFEQWGIFVLNEASELVDVLGLMKMTSMSILAEYP